MKDIVVIGGGPAGMMAAITAAENANVILLDGNEKLGKKLFITGKGRCNITNAKDISDFFDYIPGNPEFLYSALYTYTNKDVMEFIENNGTKLKVERGDRVFPVSDKSSDIIKVFENQLYKKKVNVKLNSRVQKLVRDQNKIVSAILEDKTIIKADEFIICTGGVSYPLTGSKGDGIRIAEELGHKIVKLKPSLVPIELKEDMVKELQGVSLKNVDFKVIEGNKTIYCDRGEMLFSHYGVTGPLVLSASRYIKEGRPYCVSINLKPALTEVELDKRVQKDFEMYKNKNISNALTQLLPQRLIDTIINVSGIDREKKVNSITKEERKKLVCTLQDLRFTVKGLRPISEAIVTAGGVSTLEINPSTMKSKLIDNLYFAGEVMDVDAFTGGYNIQIALSTGYIAGKNASIN
jgi:predicted Rossmann fold flavoprotein